VGTPNKPGKHFRTVVLLSTSRAFAAAMTLMQLVALPALVPTEALTEAPAEPTWMLLLDALNNAFS
jgi:hypothetical protein